MSEIMLDQGPLVTSDHTEAGDFYGIPVTLTGVHDNTVWGIVFEADGIEYTIAFVRPEARAQIAASDPDGAAAYGTVMFAFNFGFGPVPEPVQNPENIGLPYPSTEAEAFAWAAKFIGTERSEW